MPLGRAVNSAVARFPSRSPLLRCPVQRFLDSPNEDAALQVQPRRPGRQLDRAKPALLPGAARADRVVGPARDARRARRDDLLPLGRWAGSRRTRPAGRSDPTPTTSLTTVTPSASTTSASTFPPARSWMNERIGSASRELGSRAGPRSTPTRPGITPSSSTTRTESSSSCFTVRPTGNGVAAVRVIYDRWVLVRPCAEGRHPDRLVVALASDEGQASRVARPSLPKIALRSSVGALSRSCDLIPSA